MFRRRMGRSGWLVPLDGKSAVEIGDRRELFIDDFMVDALRGGVERRLHHPMPREVISWA